MTDFSFSIQSGFTNRPIAPNVRDVALPAVFDLSQALEQGLAVELPDDGNALLPDIAGGGKFLPVDGFASEIVEDFAATPDVATAFPDPLELEMPRAEDLNIPFMPAALGLVPMDTALPDQLPVQTLVGSGIGAGVAPMQQAMAAAFPGANPAAVELDAAAPLLHRASDALADRQALAPSLQSNLAMAQQAAPLASLATASVAAMAVAEASVQAQAQAALATQDLLPADLEVDPAHEEHRPEVQLLRTQELNRTTVQAASGAEKLPLDLNREDWPAKMMERIALMRAGIDAADTRIRLNPEFLGNIDVSVRRDGDRLHVHFTADNPVTRQMLAEAAPRLQELAEQRGIKLGQSSVDSGANGQGDGNGRDGDSPSQHPQSNSTRHDPIVTVTDPALDRRVA